MDTQKIRYWQLDFVKGIAVLLMIIFHFFFDLYYFGWLNLSMHSDIFWVVFRYIIASLFLGSVGISLTISQAKKFRWGAWLKRCVQLGSASLLVTVASIYLFPHSWIYFGVLHFIFVASTLILPLRQLPNVCLAIAPIIIILSSENLLHTEWLFNWLQAPLSLPHATQDLVPIFPWIGVCMIGIFIGYYELYKIPISPKPYHGLGWISFMGKHALIIYLIHQPILFAGLRLLQLL